jgi:hypothetical protein
MLKAIGNKLLKKAIDMLLNFNPMLRTMKAWSSSIVRMRSKKARASPERPRGLISSIILEELWQEYQTGDG